MINWYRGENSCAEGVEKLFLALGEFSLGVVSLLGLVVGVWWQQKPRCSHSYNGVFLIYAQETIFLNTNCISRLSEGQILLPLDWGSWVLFYFIQFSRRGRCENGPNNLWGSNCKLFFISVYIESNSKIHLNLFSSILFQPHWVLELSHFSFLCFVHGRNIVKSHSGQVMLHGDKYLVFPVVELRIS